MQTEHSAGTGKAEERFDKKAAGAIAYSVGDYVWVIRYTTEKNERAPKEVERTLHDYVSAPGGTFIQTEYRPSRSLGKY